MSTWRRIAIEHVPSFKKIVEEAENPGWMWGDLLSEASNEHTDPQKVHQIHRFAFLCLKNKINIKLSDSVILFFELLLPVVENVQFLLTYYSPEELHFLRTIFPEQFPPNMHF